MSLFNEEMERMLAFYEQLLKRYNFEYENSLDGSLQYQMRNGKVQMLHSVEIDGKKVRRGINKKDDILRDLAHKEFVKKSIGIVEHNLGVIKRAVDSYISYNPAAVVETMPKAYDLLPEEYFFDRKDIIPDFFDETDL